MARVGQRAIQLVLVLSFLSQILAQSYTYNPTWAQQMLVYAEIAYCPQQYVNPWTCNICGSNFNLYGTLYDNVTTTFGFIGVDTNLNSIVVAFQGTNPDNLENWISDLDYTLVPGTGFLNYPNLNVHDGFFASYETVSSALESAIATLVDQNPGMPIAVTGHSLGAALAVLCAMDIYATVNIAPTLYTFGTPRVGDPVFAGVVESAIPNFFRVTHYADVVAHVPPEIAGFQHAANEVWYNEDFTSYTVCYAGESPNCSDSLYLPDSIDDHTHYFNQDVGDTCAA